MVEISLSGSGEGPGWATAPGYSTAGALRSRPVRINPTISPWGRSCPLMGPPSTSFACAPCSRSVRSSRRGSGPSSSASTRRCDGSAVNGVARAGHPRARAVRRPVGNARRMAPRLRPRISSPAAIAGVRRTALSGNRQQRWARPRVPTASHHGSAMGFHGGCSRVSRAETLVESSRRGVPLQHQEMDAQVRVPLGQPGAGSAHERRSNAAALGDGGNM